MTMLKSLPGPDGYRIGFGHYYSDQAFRHPSFMPMISL